MTAVRFLALLGLLATLASGCGGDDNDNADEGNSTAVSPGSVPFDRAFIDAMVPHHESAITMAQAAKRMGLTQPDLIEIADDIIRSQQTEINSLVRWRKEWFGAGEIDPLGAGTLGLSKSEMGMLHRPEDLSGSGDVDQAFAQMQEREIDVMEEHAQAGHHP